MKKSMKRSMESRLKRLLRIEKAIDRIVGVMVALTALFLISSIYDTYKFTRAGMDTVEYRDFRELQAINPDTVAWLTVDDTHIDHPVVQGADNFSYLDRGFDGKYYAGGTLFLDEDNDPELGDSYILIHGHHMSGGAMFGDLERFLDAEFFGAAGSGVLKTGDRVYSLYAAGAGIYDAYDSDVYGAGGEIPIGKLSECVNRRTVVWEDGDKLLALSTCSGDMDDRRIVVFFRMRYAGRNDE